MVATPRAPRAAADVARDIRAEMTSTSSSVDALRAHLASALASARDASARSSSDASSDEAVRDASSLRDPRALVARFRAVNDARETLARVARAEAALRDAGAAARSVHPSSATRADLPRLREASASLLGASDALRDARDAQLCSDPPRAPAHDRFTASLAARIRAECDRLRAVATRPPQNRNASPCARRNRRATMRRTETRQRTYELQPSQVRDISVVHHSNAAARCWTRRRRFCTPIIAASCQASTTLPSRIAARP